MYIAASGVASAMARQDVISSNLANVNTVGFKPDALYLRSRDAVSVEDHLPTTSSSALLARLGAGVTPMATRVITAQGPLRQTGNTLDVAIEGDGFFVTRWGDAGGEDSLRLTRDGRLSIRSDGVLVNAASGAPVLSSSAQFLRVDRSSNNAVSVDPDGTVRQGAAEVGRLDIVNVAEPSRLVKDGNNLLRAAGQSLSPAQGRVVQGHVEQSAVDAIAAMMGVTAASNAAQSGLGIIAYYSDMMSRAISALGRVS